MGLLQIPSDLSGDATVRSASSPKSYSQAAVKTVALRLERLRAQNGKFSAATNVVMTGGTDTAAASLTAWSASSAGRVLSVLVTRKKPFVDVNVITSVANPREYRNG